MSFAISVDRLTYKYPNGHEALKDVSLAIEPRRIVALIGRNGAGKTTLAKHFIGLLKPTSGRVIIEGVDASKQTVGQMARKVGFVFQNPEDQLFGSSILEEVTFGPRNLHMEEELVKRNVENALSMVGLLSSASKHPYNLTYGQRKMLCLASVLAMDPNIIIMDEPNAGQDYNGLSSLGSMISKLKRAGKTIVIISHDIEFVAKHSEETALMDNGKIVSYDSTRRTLSDAEKLVACNVHPPQVTRLAINLSSHDIRHDIMTVDEIVDEIVGKSRKPG